MEVCKYVMNVKKCNLNCIVYGEFGRMFILVVLKVRMIGFWEWILISKKEKIFWIFYDIIYKFDIVDVYYFKRLNCIKDVLIICGYINCWRN